MSTGSAPVLVRDNPEALRYELVVDGDVAGEILYRRSPDRIALVHTEARRHSRGRASEAVLSPERSTTFAHTGFALSRSARSFAATSGGTRSTATSSSVTLRFGD